MIPPRGAFLEVFLCVVVETSRYYSLTPAIVDLLPLGNIALSRGVLCFRRKFVWFMRSRVGKDNYGLSKILQSNGALFIAFPCISISSAIRPEPRPDFAAGRGCQNADRPVGTNCVLRKLSRIQRNNSW